MSFVETSFYLEKIRRSDLDNPRLNVYYYTIYDIDFVKNVLPGIVHKYAMPARFVAIVKAYEEKELNVVQSLFTAINQAYRYDPKEAFNSLLNDKKYGSIFQKYKDDLEKYWILL